VVAFHRIEYLLAWNITHIASVLAMDLQSNEPCPDSIVADLHAIREQIVAEYGGDLKKLTAAARQRQEASGRTIIRRREAASKKASRETTVRSVGDH
jgi:hypothetical protein